MRSILLMARKSIRKRRLQNALIAMIIGVCALVLSTGIGLLRGLNGPVDKMFKETKASHDVLFINKGLYKIDDLKAWLSKQPNIEGVTYFEAYVMKEKLTINGKKVDKSIRIAERTAEVRNQDRLLIVEGEKKDNPENGEIWVPTSFAYTNGIKVGDSINIPTDTVAVSRKVSAIVVDPVNSSSLIGTISLWVNTGEIEKIFHRKGNTDILGLKYKNVNKAESTWRDFEKYLNAPFGGYRFEYKNLRSSFEELLQIAASVLIAFSMVVIICAVFVIAFTISNSILGDYKIIGILKSQGFTAKQVQWIYQLQFVFLSAISIPIGLCLSYLCVNIIMSSMLKATGINSVVSASLVQNLLTLILILLIIVITTYFSSKKACRIKPSEALKSSAADQVSKSSTSINLMKLKVCSLPFSLAIKQAASYKRQVIFIAITLFMTSLIFSGDINSYNSIKKLGNNLAYWGFDNSEVTYQFTSSEKSNITKDITKDKRVVNVVPWCWSTAAYKTETDNSKIIEILAYQGNMDSIGIVNVKGRSPIALDEVSLAVNTSKDMNKEIGDIVELYFKGKKQAFIVTGIYQSMVDGGTGARVQRKAIEKSIAEKDTNMYAVKLKKGENSISFAKELNVKYIKDIDAKQTKEVFGSFITTITDSMAYAIIFLFVIFAIITFIIVFNITLITIYQQKKDLGIFKAIGLLNSQIRLTIIYKMLLASLVGIITGIPAGIFVMPKLLNGILSNQGIVSFPFMITVIGTLAVAGACIVLVIVSVWIASGRVLEIKLNSLINE